LARQRLLQHRAVEMADIWFKLLAEGKTREAHQFRQSPSTRITSPEAIAEHYASNKEAASELKTFATGIGIKDIVLQGREADTRFEGVSSATRDGQTDTLVLKYSYVPPGALPGERKFLWININRRFEDTTKRYEWEIGGLQYTAPLGSEA
jgi:hypothetical protein